MSHGEFSNQCEGLLLDVPSVPLDEGCLADESIGEAWWRAFGQMDADLSGEASRWQSSFAHLLSTNQEPEHQGPQVLRCGGISPECSINEESSQSDCLLQENGQGTIVDGGCSSQRDDSSEQEKRPSSPTYPRWCNGPNVTHRPRGLRSSAQAQDRRIRELRQTHKRKGIKSQMVGWNSIQDFQFGTRCRLWLVGEEHHASAGFQITSAACICPPQHEQDFPSQYAREVSTNLLSPTDGELLRFLRRQRVRFGRVRRVHRY